MSIRKSVRFAVFDRDNFTCRYCGKSTDDGIILEADHVIPKSKGGSDEIENLVASCLDCNRGKSAKSIGSTAPETDRDRRRRLQELAETQRSAEELVALSSAKRERIQTWANIIGEEMSLKKVDRKFCEQAERLANEFGDSDVVEWIGKLSAKFSRMDNNAAKYLNGIARMVRTQQ
jgi:hypothetical protein